MKPTRSSTRIWNIDRAAATCTCRVHGDGAPLRERRRSDRPSIELSCRTCDRGPNRHGGNVRAQTLRKKYDLTEEDVAAMFAGQGGVCAICRAPMEQVNVDHDHDTGTVRGLLCSPCNMGLGMFRDNSASMSAAIDYLARSSPIVAAPDAQPGKLF